MNKTESHFGPSAKLTTLQRRAQLTTALRGFFQNEGYWEVETPLWSRDTCVDAWINPVPVTLDSAGDGYLQTSPEFHMKRLVAAGADRIWSLTRSFRNGEIGRLHNPEFSIVEWYRVGETDVEAIAFTEMLVRKVAAGSHLICPDEPFLRVSYYDAFERVLGSRVEDLTANELAAVAIEHAPEAIGPNDRDGWLNVLLAACVEPWLATLGPVFLVDYPASQAALAKVRSGEPPVAERFELYIDGVEIANGYHELTDASELRKRFQEQNARRNAAGLEVLEIETRLLHAMMHGLPDCAGVALGWDRLVMLCLGETSFADVVAFPAEIA